MGKNSIKSLWKGGTGENLSSERFSPDKYVKTAI